MTYGFLGPPLGHCQGGKDENVFVHGHIVAELLGQEQGQHGEGQTPAQAGKVFVWLLAQPATELLSPPPPEDQEEAEADHAALGQELEDRNP